MKAVLFAFRLSKEPRVKPVHQIPVRLLRPTLFGKMRLTVEHLSNTVQVCTVQPVTVTVASNGTIRLTLRLPISRLS
jgi:hypothetical protein